jgi:hypothetical protein
MTSIMNASVTTYAATMANPVPQPTLIEIGIKFLLTEGVERQWKIPILYNELRQIRGENSQVHIEPYAHLDIFETELKCVLDAIMPEHYTFTDDGESWHTWANFATRNEISDDSDDSDDDSDGWSDDDSDLMNCDDAYGDFMDCDDDDVLQFPFEMQQ